MTPNNNLSVLPWYKSIEEQNARKWWAYGRIYPLFVPSGYLLPFQIILGEPVTLSDLEFLLQKSDGTFVADLTQNFNDAGIYQSIFADYAIISFFGNQAEFSSIKNGQYYLTIGDGEDTLAVSEVFTAVEDITPYMKIEWYDREDFMVSDVRIQYKIETGSGVFAQFKNVIYLNADIAKPEYVFEDEGETRDGYFFPTKQISEKKYKFTFLSSEYLLDVMRFIRMSDVVTITKQNQVYEVDSFLITPKWEGEGDVAVVEAEFETDMVAKKTGLGYIK